jgi:cell division protein FtsW (lipid II flippase)
MEIAIVVGILIILFLVTTWALKVMRATLRIAILIAIALLVLFIVGIGPQTVWEQLQNWLPGFEPVNSQ